MQWFGQINIRRRMRWEGRLRQRSNHLMNYHQTSTFTHKPSPILSRYPQSTSWRGSQNITIATLATMNATAHELFEKLREDVRVRARQMIRDATFHDNIAVSRQRSCQWPPPKIHWPKPTARMSFKLKQQWKSGRCHCNDTQREHGTRRRDDRCRSQSPESFPNNWPSTVSMCTVWMCRRPTHDSARRVLTAPRMRRPRRWQRPPSLSSHHISYGKRN